MRVLTGTIELWDTLAVPDEVASLELARGYLAEQPDSIEWQGSWVTEIDTTTAGDSEPKLLIVPPVYVAFRAVYAR